MRALNQVFCTYGGTTSSSGTGWAARTSFTLKGRDKRLRIRVNRKIQAELGIIRPFFCSVDIRCNKRVAHSDGVDYGVDVVDFSFIAVNI